VRNELQLETFGIKWKQLKFDDSRKASSQFGILPT
jgi:hypothetical protein